MAYAPRTPTIANEKNKEFSNQITMFDIANDEKEINEMKYKFEEKEEFSEKELLSMEKEMLGIYISGHPLEKYRKKIEETTNLNTILITWKLLHIEYINVI